MTRSPATPSPVVDVLLATYNGAAFLAAQLESLQRQTCRAWRLIARDDGSSDETRAVLAEFRRRATGEVVLIEDADARLGIGGNFQRLLECSTAEHVAFCDQDDVWRPEKLERLLGLAHGALSAGQPLLVHSDLEVVDREGRTIAPSFWRYQKIDPTACTWSRLLVQNVATGCASLINAELRRQMLPLPAEAIMHDWWAALIAAAAGRIAWTAEPLVRYRQHGANDTGAKRWSTRYVLGHAPEFFRRRAFREKFSAYQRQAGALARHAHASVPPALRADLIEFAELARRPYPQRVAFLWRHRIAKTGWLRNFALWSRI